MNVLLAIVGYAAAAVLVGRVIARQPGNDAHVGAVMGFAWPFTLAGLLLYGVLRVLAALIGER